MKTPERGVEHLRFDVRLNDDDCPDLAAAIWTSQIFGQISGRAPLLCWVLLM